MENLSFKEVTDKNLFPWKLLLEADPSKEMVNQYLLGGKIYGAFMGDELIGEYVLFPISKEIVELKNVAVDDLYKGKGFGKKIVLNAIYNAKKNGFKKIIVGT